MASYTAAELFASGLFFTIVAYIFSPIAGRVIGLGCGMYLIFCGWLQFINFYGDAPSDQTFIKYYKISKEEMARLDSIANYTDMSKQDWSDYHLCKDHNVCVHKFERKRKEVNTTPPDTLMQLPKFESSQTPPRCIQTAPAAVTCFPPKN